MIKNKTSTWAACSGCGKKYLVPVLMLGRWARCKECEVKFRLAESSKDNQELQAIDSSKNND